MVLPANRFGENHTLQLTIPSSTRSHQKIRFYETVNEKDEIKKSYDGDSPLSSSISSGERISS